MFFEVYRDCDQRFRLRKVVVTLWGKRGEEPAVVDRTRMFAGPLFTWRLARRLAKMRARAAVMIAVASAVK